MAARAWAGRIGQSGPDHHHGPPLGDRLARSDILEQLWLVDTVLNLLMKLDALNQVTICFGVGLVSADHFAQY